MIDTLAQRMGELARQLQEQHGVDDTLRSIVHAAVDTIPGAQYAGISVIERRATVRTPVFSDDIVAKVDQAQIELAEGPCVDVLYQRQTVRSSNLATEPRWPRFAARAVELGVHSMLSFQLFVTGDDLGALNLYSERSGAFSDDDAEEIGLLFAAHAAVAMADAQNIANLTIAVASRDLIGQAKGILMERYQLTSDQAFDLLVRTSQTTNTKLHQIADYLVRSRQLPGGTV
ncbi:GAF and ANTAR domain-containing protein [Jiangella rhizosphaerae]|uniref:GAF and ANTAR domain-containing protein n=1 Tax=Jiangella rhizosphaerae TaxID=2293569 RepID=UPI0018F69199|nr:GAF and ANTAR domain-containing protein [Jiangella rhizosphaerae]